MSDQYVIVTIADNGVIHAWGDGPVVDGKVTPFTTQIRARTVVRRFRRQETEEAPWYPDRKPMTVRVCKILGTKSVLA